MNRQERRKIDKKNLTARDIKSIQDSSKSKGIDVATSAIFASLALTLQDKWQWDNMSIKKLLAQVDELFDSVNNGYLSIEDLKKTVNDEIGIDMS